MFIFDNIAAMGGLLGLAAGLFAWAPIHRAADRIFDRLFPAKG